MNCTNSEGKVQRAPKFRQPCGTPVPAAAGGRRDLSLPRGGVLRFLVALVAAVPLLGPAPASAERIAVREGVLRQEPSPFGAIKTKLPYDTGVKVGKKENGWLFIVAPESGWLHGSAVSIAQQPLQLTPGKAGPAGAVADNEVALAGKGFDQNVEAAYRKEHGQLRYDLMDQVEKITVPETEVLEFAQAGGTGVTP